MSYDPNSNQSSEPNDDRPNYETPNPYGNPNTPYGPPSEPYSNPNTPYGAPNAPYGPPSGPYGNPDTPYGEVIPPKSPLPLGDAIRGLPNQYIRAITKPGTAVFAEEQGKAAWNIIWVELIILAIISALSSLVTFNTSFNRALSSSSGAAASQQILQSLRSNPGVSAIGFLIFTPIAFFIGSGIYHLIAKAFGGRGTYLAYCYSYLLFGVPMAFVSGVLRLIPFVGSFLTLPVSIYQIVLMVFMTMAVHRLSGGKATLAVLILPIIVVVLSCIIGIVLVTAIAGSIHSH